VNKGHAEECFFAAFLCDRPNLEPPQRAMNESGGEHGSALTRCRAAIRSESKPEWHTASWINWHLAPVRDAVVQRPRDSTHRKLGETCVNQWFRITHAGSVSVSRGQTGVRAGVRSTRFCFMIYWTVRLCLLYLSICIHLQNNDIMHISNIV
jgi:hypothetical protein